MNKTPSPDTPNTEPHVVPQTQGVAGAGTGRSILPRDKRLTQVQDRPMGAMTLAASFSADLFALESQDRTHHTPHQPLVQRALEPRQQLAQRFDIIRPLGKGGMGAVYLAQDLVLERDVAIKTLLTDHLNHQAQLTWLQMFRREASSTARLQHPNIVTLHDFGFAEGIPFLVLEHLRGATLDQLLQQGPLPPIQVLDFARQLTSALAHAHNEGVIHRDLKPSNLFIDEGERLKIMDFGVALLQQDRQHLIEAFGKSSHSLKALLGESPAVAGTPMYMAPEQLRGKPQDARTDLWSLGVVLVEMLSGKRLFRHGMDILSGEPLWDSLLGPHIPPALNAVINQCLQHNINARAISATHLHNLLQNTDASFFEMSQMLMHPTRVRIPRREDSFVGRQSELNFLEQHFGDSARLITLLGAAGSGKTRLAIQTATLCQTHFDAVYFCDLTEARREDDITRLVSHVLEIPLTQHDALTQLAHALSSLGRMLLVLDNFEQVVDHAQTTLGYWLSQAPELHVLITSRQRLELHEERVLSLEPLPTPATGALSDITHSDAVKLFVERAQEHAPGFRLKPTNADAIAALVSTLDGLPLAIELAAARARMMTPAQMLKRMHRRFELLRGHRHNLTDRQARACP